MIEKLFESIDKLLESPELLGLAQDRSVVIKNNLIKYRNAFANPGNKKEQCEANKVFGKFLTDGFDWDDPIYKRCSEIGRIGRGIERGT